jgi:ribosomal protein S18 acetylase RimI-like enzyme
LEIRMAAEKDYKEVSAVEAECFPPAEAASEKSLQSRLSVYPNHFWLLWDEERLVGFVNGMTTDCPDLSDEMYQNASMHTEDGAWQMIFGVAVLPEYRRQGLAERILRRVISDAKAQGRRGLVLTCKERLLPYYAKLGFQNEGVSESVHGGEVWYQMRLTF